jgi:RHS repeat-associated protein
MGHPATNQITAGNGYTYHAAGNMTNDGFHSYTYDAEGNILQVDGGQTASYVYDALNRRVRAQTASATYEFMYDYAGRRTSSWYNPSSGNPGAGNEGRIYWDGTQIAYRAYNGQTYFDHRDWLGTERMRTGYTGAVAATFTSLPFGDGAASTLPGGDPAIQDNASFATLDQDPESNTHHAQFRNYSPTQGRWLTPDPYSGSYDITNPQSMNRYAYVLNNPLTFTDPLGLEDPTGDGGCDPSVQACTPTSGSGGGGGGGGSGNGSTPPPDCNGNFTACDNENPTQPAGCNIFNCYSGTGLPLLGMATGGTGAAPSNGTYTFHVTVTAKSAAGAVAAPATFCTTYPTICTLGTDITSVLEAIPPVAASVLLFNMQGDNSSSARCSQVRQQAITSCSQQFVGRGYGSDAPGLVRQCVRQIMESAGCSY